jgi:hypothetical protein
LYTRNNAYLFSNHVDATHVSENSSGAFRGLGRAVPEAGRKDVGERQQTTQEENTDVEGGISTMRHKKEKKQKKKKKREKQKKN